MSVERLKYPGYRWSYGGTRCWFRKPDGPFVSYVYTPPDEDGMSIRTETFHNTFEEAGVRCGAST